MSTSTSPYLREPRYDAHLLDVYIAAAPEEVRAKVLRHPLTDDQAGAFYALLERGNGDFLWTNASSTERLLRALVSKGLATYTERPDRWGNIRGHYAPEPGARAAFVEHRQALERARREEQARKQAEREAQVAAKRARLERDVQTLTSALDLWEDRFRPDGEIPPDVAADITFARERVRSLAATFLG